MTAAVAASRGGGGVGACARGAGEREPPDERKRYGSQSSERDKRADALAGMGHHKRRTRPPRCVPRRCLEYTPETGDARAETIRRAKVGAADRHKEKSLHVNQERKTTQDAPMVHMQDSQDLKISENSWTFPIFRKLRVHSPESVTHGTPRTGRGHGRRCGVPLAPHRLAAGARPAS